MTEQQLIEYLLTVDLFFHSIVIGFTYFICREIWDLISWHFFGRRDDVLALLEAENNQLKAHILNYCSK